MSKDVFVKDFKLYILRLPMCPSVNESLAFYKGRMISTKKMRLWKKQIKSYHAINKKDLELGAKFLRDNMVGGFPALKVTANHVFPYKDVWTKDGRPKVIDGHNRNKAMLDALGGLIGIDDKYYFEVNSQKLTGEGSRITNICVELTSLEKNFVPIWPN